MSHLRVVGYVRPYKSAVPCAGQCGLPAPCTPASCNLSEQFLSPVNNCDVHPGVQTADNLLHGGRGCRLLVRTALLLLLLLAADHCSASQEPAQSSLALRRLCAFQRTKGGSQEMDGRCGSGRTLDGAEEFCFPFTPYAVQVELMNSLYECLNEGQVGIFESPTGTGKSMSLICSSLRWLKENPVYVPPSENTVAEDEDLPAWVIEHAKKKEQDARESAIKAEKERLERARSKMEEDACQREREREKAERDRAKVARPTVGMPSRPGAGGTRTGEKMTKEERGIEREAEQLVLSDDESDKRRDKTADEVLQMLFAESEEAEEERKDEEVMDVRKIIYCSRTHSQLSQFMREVKRTRWGGDLKVPVMESERCSNAGTPLQRQCRNSPTTGAFLHMRSTFWTQPAGF